MERGGGFWIVARDGSESKGSLAMHLKPTFKTPASMKEAEERRLQLLSEIQTINGQLGDRNRTDESGNRLPDEAYWTWRKGAVRALRHREDELRLVNKYIREQNNAARYKRIDVAAKDYKGLLVKADEVFQSLKKEGFDFEEKEWDIVLAIHEALKG